jgi:hypothetical protein
LGGALSTLPATPLEALTEQVLEVPADAVDREQAQIVDVHVAVLVGVADLGGIDLVQPVLGGHIGGDVVVEPLQGVAHIAVFFYFPVQALNVVIHQVDIGLGGDVADLGVLFAVEDIGLGGHGRGVEQDALDDVLNFLDFRQGA